MNSLYIYKYCIYIQILLSYSILLLFSLFYIFLLVFLDLTRCQWMMHTIPQICHISVALVIVVVRPHILLLLPVLPLLLVLVLLVLQPQQRRPDWPIIVLVGTTSQWSLSPWALGHRWASLYGTVIVIVGHSSIDIVI